MPFIVQTSAAHMPNSVRSPYRRVAVIQVEPGVAKVAMISDRARGVVRIVQTWERLHARGVNTAYHRALLEAEALAARMNASEDDHATMIRADLADYDQDRAMRDYAKRLKADLDRDPIEKKEPTP